LERVYQEALAIEFAANGIEFVREYPGEVMYRDVVLDCQCRPGFLCLGEVIVVLKVVEQLSNIHFAQLFNDLKSTGLLRGLLLNFGRESLEFKRLVQNYNPQSSV